jgi:hypothetical protein
VTFRKKLRFSVLALAFPWAAAVACGSRTGDLTPFDDFPSSGGTGAIGVSTGGIAAHGPTGTGGRSTGTGGRPIGAGGSVTGAGAFVGKGGVPSFGAGPGTGGTFLDCVSPTCQNCGNCLSECECALGFDNPMCPIGCGSFGTGGAIGAAGAPVIIGSGGFGGGLTTGPTECITPGSIVACATPMLPVNTCCTQTGQCGVELVSDPVPQTLPFAAGCQAMNQPGYDSPSCPDLGSLIGAAPSVNVAGCCRIDGTCGVNLDVVGVGCVQTLIGGKPFFCAFPDAGVGRDSGLPVPGK